MSNLLLSWWDLFLAVAPWCCFLLLLDGIGWYSFRTRTLYPPQPEQLKDSDRPDTWAGYRHGGLGG